MIAMLHAEPGFERLRYAIAAAEMPARMASANYLETAIVIDAKRNTTGSRALDDLIEELEIEVVPFTADHARIAREAYRDYGKGSGHPAKLNFGDCFAYALARERGEPLLFKGDDFAQTDVVSAL